MNSITARISGLELGNHPRRLLALRPPIGGEVAVEVEPFQRGCDRDDVAVVVLDHALGEEPVIGAAFLIRPALDHQPRVALRDLPVACRVGDAHLEDAAVAVDVGGVQAVLFVLERVWPCAERMYFGGWRSAYSSPSGLSRGTT